MSAVCQVQAFTSKAAVAPRQSRGRVVRVAAVQQQEAAAPLRFLAAGLAAVAVSTCGSPAEAGVVLVQPEVKNFVKDTAPAPKAAKEAAAPGEKKAAAPKAAKQAEEPSAPGSGFEGVRPFIFPLSVLLVGAGGAAAAKLDPEFARMFDKTWSAKDSIGTGAGYETAPGMKDGPLFGGSNTVGKGAPKKSTGTKKVAGTRTSTGTPKKSSVLGSIFGSRD